MAMSSEVLKTSRNGGFPAPCL